MAKLLFKPLILAFIHTNKEEKRADKTLTNTL